MPHEDVEREKRCGGNEKLQQRNLSPYRIVHEIADDQREYEIEGAAVLKRTTAGQSQQDEQDHEDRQALND